MCTNLEFDLANCGVCGGRCAAAQNAVPYCDGACRIACEDGYEDCDGDPANGCEGLREIRAYDGMYESSVGWADPAPSGTRVSLVASFELGPTSSVIGAVSLDMRSPSVRAADLRIVIFDDDGPGGTPGTQLYSFDHPASSIPRSCGTSGTTFVTAPTPASGRVYAGVEWDASRSVGLFVCADYDGPRPPPRPPWPTYWQTTPGMGWQRVEDLPFHEGRYRGIGIRLSLDCP